MPITLDISKKSATISVDGECSVAQAAELKDALLTALGDARKVSLDFSRMTSADVSTLQLVCAAHRAAQTAGVGMEFSSLPKAIASVIEGLGFIRHMPCAFDESGLCLLCMKERKRGSR